MSPMYITEHEAQTPTPDNGGADWLEADQWGEQAEPVVRAAATLPKFCESSPRMVSHGFPENKTLLIGIT